MTQAFASDWPRISPEEAGLPADLADRADAAAAAGEFGNVHAILVARNGKLLLERYYKGEDEAWGDDLGEVQFGPDVLHDLRSVSKSVVGLLYGIALDKGLVPGLDAVLIDQFPALADLAEEPERRRILVRHALTMNLGLEWDETRPYLDERNSEIAMEYAEDRVQYVLSRPIVAPAGTAWQYSGGATAILGQLIVNGSGMSLEAFAAKHLFEPLGIKTYHWTRGGRTRTHVAASGLRLLPADLAKIGQLLLQNGEWNGRQIVPLAWLEESLKAQSELSNPGPFSYGYHWYVGVGQRSGQPFQAAFGNGGQTLVINPAEQQVYVFMAGAYNELDAWKLSIAFNTKVYFPALDEAGMR